MTTATQTNEKAGIPWWLVLVEGIALILIGGFLLMNTGKGTVFLVQVMGFYWVISGIFQLISLFIDRTAWGWKLFAGIISIMAGLVIIGQPLMSTIVVLNVAIIILAIQGIVYGGIGLYQAFKGAGWGAGILGAVSIFFGIFLLANSFVAMVTLPYVIAIFAIVGGIFAIIAAFKMK